MRIVALSDQHGTFPEVPPCEILIVAGDICPDFPSAAQKRIIGGPDVPMQEAWFYNVWMPWRRAQPARYCILTWGNHDHCGMHISQSALTWLDGTTVAVVDSEVQLFGLNIWLTPWSSSYKDWSFVQEEERLKSAYAPIPQGLNILVSHQPMRGYCDESSDGRMGSLALLEAVQRTRPDMLICGHIHGGYGQDIAFYTTTSPVHVHNVAIMDETYSPVHYPTEIVL